MKLLKTITLLTLLVAAAVPAHGMQEIKRRRKTTELKLCHDVIGVVLSFIYHAKDSDTLEVTNCVSKENFDRAKELFSKTCVCKKFRESFAEYHYPKTVFFIHIINATRLAGAIKFIKTHPRHSFIVDLYELKDLTDKELQQIVTASPNIRSLNIHSRLITNEGFENINPKKLICLNITGNHSIDDEAVEKFTNLKKLRLHNCNISDNVFKSLTKIEDLSINFCPKIENENFYHLKNIRILFFKDFTAGDMDHIAGIGALSDHGLNQMTKNLKYLHLHLCPLITNKSIKNLKDIKCLVLEFCAGIYDGGIFHLNPEFIHVNSCKNISKSIVELINKRAENRMNS
jgi:hypothetical protein